MFKPRFNSAYHQPSSTERLMNPFYHSQFRLPPYRQRSIFRYEPYSRPPAQTHSFKEVYSDLDYLDEAEPYYDAFAGIELLIPPRGAQYSFPDPPHNSDSGGYEADKSSASTSVDTEGEDVPMLVDEEDRGQCDEEIAAPASQNSAHPTTAPRDSGVTAPLVVGPSPATPPTLHASLGATVRVAAALEPSSAPHSPAAMVRGLTHF